ncbi:MAG: four helix bundle protein [Campylobacterota bacterium]|nr:four helix bundle protein [Campylobacterota bacterium]
MNCKNLDVWKRSCRISVEIYKHFSASSDFGFKDQITRSSLSIASNIAEGMEKDSNKDKIRFLNISQGSISELITQTYIGIEIDYIKKEIGIKWIEELEQLLKMLSNLKKSLK